MTARFETFTVRIAKISRSIRRIKDQGMAEYGLKSVHVSCLYYLYRQDGLTLTELAERCEEDKATICRAVDFLERNGFLTRTPTAGRRYKSPLLLTEQGRAIGQQVAEKVDALLDQISVALTERERAEFYRSLTAISDLLEKIAEQSGNE